jgi:hypothetical protein
MRLRDLPSIPMYEGGWILLGERPGEEIALGLVGKFWRPVIEFARIDSADEFREFDEPGSRRRSTTSRARARTQTDAPLGPDANGDHRRARARLVSPLLDLRRRLRRHVLVGSLLDSARRAAEGNGDPVACRMEGGFVKTRPLSSLEAVRAFGMMLGGSIALAAAAGSSLSLVARALVSVPTALDPGAVGAVATVMYARFGQALASAFGVPSRRTRSASCPGTSCCGPREQRSSTRSRLTPRLKMCGPGSLSSARIAVASTATSGLRTSPGAR